MIQPFFDRVVIREDAPKDTTDKGLFIPENAKDRPNTGTVVATGQGYMLASGPCPLSVKVNDHVLYLPMQANRVAVDGEELVMVRERDVLGVIED